MLSSKANAALARLREIEEKYKIRREEQKWKEDADSSISSVSIAPSENSSAKSKESPRKTAKLKLDIKMPNARFEGHVEEMKLSSRSEKSTDKANAKPPKDAAEIDLDVAMSLDDKSSRSARKQESLISDTMTIQETSLIESVLDDSMTPSKSFSRSKTLRRNSSTTNDKSSGREEMRTKAAAKSVEGEESGKSSEILRGKAQSDNSIAKRLRLSRKSNEISKMHLDRKKHAIVDKAIVKTSKKVDKNQDDSNDMVSSRDGSIVEKSIGTMMENGSEIISEFSSSVESSIAQIKDIPKGSKRPTDENASATVSNSLKGLMTENDGYANDTFEDISNSTILLEREEMINGKKEVVDGARSNAKEINIAEHESYQDSAKEHRDGPVIALNLTPKPRATKINSGQSHYVSESIANPDNTTVHSIKLPQSAGSSSRNQRRHYQHQKASFRNENVSSATSSNTNTLDSSKSSTDDVTKTDERKNSPEITTVQQESGRKERGEASNRARERAVIDVTRLPVANDEDWIESAKSNLSLEENEERRQEVSGESLDQQISQDVDYALKKSHKDVLAKKYANSKIATETSEGFHDSKTVSQVRNASKTRKVITEKENENCRCSKEKDKVSNHNFRGHNIKRKKKEARTNSKSAGTRKSTESRKEDKGLSFDGKQMRRLRKQIVELRLRQEREDLQKYIHELKDLRLESGSTRSYFRPLEFPKIAEFTPDVNNLESKPDDQYREKVLAIRRWLKDQYVLYRDYCTMAQAINAHYVPTTLDDAKKLRNTGDALHKVMSCTMANTVLKNNE